MMDDAYTSISCGTIHGICISCKEKDHEMMDLSTFDKLLTYTK